MTGPETQHRYLLGLYLAGLAYILTETERILSPTPPPTRDEAPASTHESA